MLKFRCVGNVLDKLSSGDLFIFKVIVLCKQVGFFFFFLSRNYVYSYWVINQETIPLICCKSGVTMVSSVESTFSFITTSPDVIQDITGVCGSQFLKAD